MSKLIAKLACGVLVMLIIIAGAPACATDEPEYANQMVESALKGVNDSNYAEFTKYFNPLSKAFVTESDFYARCDEIKSLIGDYVSKHYWKVETTAEGYTIVYYKAKFSNETGDVYVRAYFEESNGETYIYNFELQSTKLNSLATSTTPTTSTGE